MERLGTFAAMAALALVGCGAGSTARAAEMSTAWSAVACDAFDLVVAEGSGVLCGYVTVPLRHAEPTGPTIELATVILPAVDAVSEPDPLFVAQGGPGGSTIGTYGQVLLDAPEMRPTGNRAIVLWDQRGTLHSKPALTCPELGAQWLDAAATGMDDDRAEVAAAMACGARLAEDTDLSAFNSAENADDIEDVRRALGFGEINFYGVSYGTELGQFLMRQHPEALRSVILDAVVPLSYNLLTEPAFAQQRIGAKYLRGCEEQPRCAAAFPDLASRYLALVERLNQAPVTVLVTSFESLESSPVQLTGDLLEEAVFTGLYANVQALIPLIVDRADRGDFTYVTSLLLPLLLYDDTIAEGMHLAVTCADRGDTDADAAAFPDVLPRLAESTREQARSILEICRAWRIALLPRGQLEPVASAIPTLMLSGDYDPITPPDYAASLLPHLSKGQHVVFPGGSHGQAVTNPCANELIRGFLDAPEAAVDTGCVGTVAPEFATDEDVIFLAVAQKAMASNGIAGLFVLGLLGVPALMCALALLTAVPVYAIGVMIRWIRGQRPPRNAAPSRWVSRLAPWLAIVAGGLILAFVAGLALAVGATFATNENLIAMGAISTSWKWIFSLPMLVGVVAAAMVVVAFVLWRTGQRSLAGRLYFTVLTCAAVAGALNLGLVDW